MKVKNSFFKGFIFPKKQKCKGSLYNVSKFDPASNCVTASVIVIIVITYLSSCLGQETAKGPFSLHIKLPPAQLPPTQCRLHTVTLIGEHQSREAVNTNFSSLWLHPTGKQTHVYHFSSTHSIASTSDQFIQ